MAKKTQELQVAQAIVMRLAKRIKTKQETQIDRPVATDEPAPTEMETLD